MITPIASFNKLGWYVAYNNIIIPQELEDQIIDWKINERSYPIVQSRTNGGDNNTNDQGAGDDDWISLSFQEGGTNYNEQIGFVNANAQANLNVSIFDSGSGATAVSLGAGATAALGVLTVAASVVAVATAVVGLAQMVDTQQRQRNYETYIKGEQERLRQIQQDISIATLEGKLEAKTLETRITLQTEALNKNKTLLLVSAGLLAVSGFVLAYKLKTR